MFEDNSMTNLEASYSMRKIIKGAGCCEEMMKKI